MDRIVALAATELPAVRPAGFELHQAWRTIAATIEQRRTHARATVVAEGPVLESLRRQFGTGVIASRRTAGGRFEVEIGSNSPRVLAAQLAGWGAAIEVRGPPEIREHLARIGAELVAAHRGFRGPPGRTGGDSLQ